MPPAVVPVEFAATFASGGSAGKEGPSAQIGAGLASMMADLLYSSLFFGWQITIPALNTLPIKKIAIDRQQPFVTLVEQILALKQKDPNANTIVLERQIDRMVYDLYELTPEEIKIVENSTH
jgi:hypothetical protein